MVAGVAGLIAGAMSMAAGEYVSVSSQADAEKADLEKERAELANDPGFELEEQTQIYEERGLDRALAESVARQLTEKDALGAHLRDELGITDMTAAKPLVAAGASAAAFACGSLIPVLVIPIAPRSALEITVTIVALLCLVGLGALGARAGDAPKLRAIIRVTAWGAFAMAATALIGSLFGAVV